MASKSLTSQPFNYDGSGTGEELLARARGNLKSVLWKSGAIRQALSPGVVRQIINFDVVADYALPSDPTLRERVMRALQAETGWSLDIDALNAAMALWLSEQLEPCLEEIWSSRVRIKIRVTRHEISVESIDGRASPNVGRLPPTSGKNSSHFHA